MGAVFSEVRSLGILAGVEGQWFHSTTGTTTIAAQTGQQVILNKILLNTNGGAVIVRDSTGVIATIAADAPEGTFDYELPLKGSLIVENGGSDITVKFVNR